MMDRREMILQRIARAEEELARLENLPDFSDLENGSVIFFKKRFASPAHRVYNYAAIKHAGRWYLTSNRVGTSGFNDTEMAEFIVDSWPTSQPLDIWWATEWESVV